MKQNKIGRDMLEYLAVGGLVTIAMLSPVGGPKVAISLLKHLKYKIKQIRASAYYLKKRGRIEFVREKDNDIIVKITDNGRAYLKSLNIDKLCLKKPAQWDGKWRIVIFDIPEKHKKARNALRQKLIDLNFEKLQKSVWVTPFECGDEIRFLREIFNIPFNVDLIIAEDIGYHEIGLKKIFKLS